MAGKRRYASFTLLVTSVGGWWNVKQINPIQILIQTVSEKFSEKWHKP